jgi:hypothetical protein
VIGVLDLARRETAVRSTVNAAFAAIRNATVETLAHATAAI